MDIKNIESTYTNGNDEYLKSVLEKLPVVSAIGDGYSTIRIVTSRPLTASEAFTLGSIADKPENITNDQTVFDLWFD